ncbi:Hydrophobic surface binding protein [Mycena sanguinolenta]|uniref:Hydrophobic surface binding protein n=1 Tax=Mycena sanguinolenta TaxID=230812 RepID=A0A8H6XZW6_9AGAR|nr:Hydrophobic surface binding protein [Mycena sanguinolenta]
MVQFTRSFFSLCLIAASFAAPAKRTVTQVEADIASISTQVNVLSNAIQGLPASGLVGALAISTAVELLDTLLNIGTSDIKATGPLDEAGATTISNSVQTIGSDIINAMIILTSEEFSITEPFRRQVAHQLFLDLTKLENSIDEFYTTLVWARYPLSPGEILYSIHNAIEAAIAAFS